MTRPTNKSLPATLATAAGSALLVLSLAAPAMAERGGGNAYPASRSGEGRGAYNAHAHPDRLVRRDHRDYRDHRDHRNADRCPPGLAMRHDGCVPPGHYRRDSHRDWNRDWRRGDRVEGHDYRALNDYRRYHLRRPPHGERYVIVGNQILRVNSDTLAVIATAGLIGALMNN